MLELSVISCRTKLVYVVLIISYLSNVPVGWVFSSPCFAQTHPRAEMNVSCARELSKKKFLLPPYEVFGRMSPGISRVLVFKSGVILPIDRTG